MTFNELTASKTTVCIRKKFSNGMTIGSMNNLQDQRKLWPKWKSWQKSAKFKWREKCRKAD